MLALEVKRGIEPATVVYVRQSLVLLGANAQAGSDTRDPQLSREGAAMRYANIHVRKGRWYLEDLGSPQKTYVNDRRVIGAWPIDVDDQLRIGDHSLRVRAIHNRGPSPAAASPPPDFATEPPAPSDRQDGKGEDKDKDKGITWLRLEASWPSRYGESNDQLCAEEILLLNMPVEIGRAVAGVRLDDTRVSRRHCRLWFDHDRWLAEDLDSTHGTLLNGRALRGSHPLAPGDELQLGRVRLRVREAVVGGRGQGDGEQLPLIGPAPPSPAADGDADRRRGLASSTAEAAAGEGSWPTDARDPWGDQSATSNGVDKAPLRDSEPEDAASAAESPPWHDHAADQSQAGAWLVMLPGPAPKGRLLEIHEQWLSGSEPFERLSGDPDGQGSATANGEAGNSSAHGAAMNHVSQSPDHTQEPGNAQASADDQVPTIAQNQVRSSSDPVLNHLELIFPHLKKPSGR